MTTTAHADLHQALLALITKRREEAFEALEKRTAFEWNNHPRCKIRVLSWSDFWRYEAYTAGEPMTWAEFRRRRTASRCTLQFMVPFSELTPED